MKVTRPVINELDARLAIEVGALELGLSNGGEPGYFSWVNASEPGHSWRVTWFLERRYWDRMRVVISDNKNDD